MYFSFAIFCSSSRSTIISDFPLNTNDHRDAIKSIKVIVTLNNIIPNGATVSAVIPNLATTFSDTLKTDILQTIRRTIVDHEGLLVTEIHPGDGKVYPKDGQKNGRRGYCFI